MALADRLDCRRSSPGMPRAPIWPPDAGEPPTVADATLFDGRGPPSRQPVASRRSRRPPAALDPAGPRAGLWATTPIRARGPPSGAIRAGAAACRQVRERSQAALGRRPAASAARVPLAPRADAAAAASRRAARARRCSSRSSAPDDRVRPRRSSRGARGRCATGRELARDSSGDATRRRFAEAAAIRADAPPADATPTHRARRACQ